MFISDKPCLTPPSPSPDAVMHAQGLFGRGAKEAQPLDLATAGWDARVCWNHVDPRVNPSCRPTDCLRIEARPQLLLLVGGLIWFSIRSSNKYRHIYDRHNVHLQLVLTCEE